MPRLESLQRAQASRGLAVVGVNAREDTRAVRRPAEPLSLTFPLVLDPGGKINALYGVIDLPTIFIVGRDGRAVAFGVGPHDVGERACRCAPRGAAGRAGLTRRRTMTRLGRREVLAGILLTMGVRGGRDLGAQPARLVKIGALTESWGPSTTIVGLRDGLQERGYRENTDFVIGVRFTQGSLSELPQAARDLVANGVDVIVASGEGQAPKAAQMVTS